MKLVTCLAPFYWSTIDPYSSLKFQIFSYTCLISQLTFCVIAISTSPDIGTGGKHYNLIFNFCVNMLNR